MRFRHGAPGALCSSLPFRQHVSGVCKWRIRQGFLNLAIDAGDSWRRFQADQTGDQRGPRGHQRRGFFWSSGDLTQDCALSPSRSRVSGICHLIMSHSDERDGRRCRGRRCSFSVSCLSVGSQVTEPLPLQFLQQSPMPQVLRGNPLETNEGSNHRMGARSLSHGRIDRATPDDHRQPDHQIR